MLGIFLREIVVIMMLITLNTLPFVSTVASPICSRVVSIIAMKQRSRATEKFIWISALTTLLKMVGTINGPKVVEVMA